MLFRYSEQLRTTIYDNETVAKYVLSVEQLLDYCYYLPINV
jgi:hypothetical protein